MILILAIHIFFFLFRAGRGRGELVLKHSVSIKTLPFSTFRRILEALRLEWRESTPRKFLFMRRYFVFTCFYNKIYYLSIKKLTLKNISVLLHLACILITFILLCWVLLIMNYSVIPSRTIIYFLFCYLIFYIFLF